MVKYWNQKLEAQIKTSEKRARCAINSITAVKMSPALPNYHFVDWNHNAAPAVPEG